MSDEEKTQTIAEAEAAAAKIFQILQRLGHVSMEDLRALPQGERQQYIFRVANGAALALGCMPGIQAALALVYPNQPVQQRVDHLTVGLALIFGFNPVSFLQRQKDGESAGKAQLN